MTKHSINLSNIANSNVANKISPKIILDSLIEINNKDSINTIFSDKEIFLILKYLNDFLTDEFKKISFERLKELKIYRPLWFDSYVQLSTSSSENNSKNSNVYLISEEIATIMKRCFKKNPFEKISTETFKIPSLKSSELFSEDPTESTFKFIIKHKELYNLFSHMNLYELSDLDFFSNLCIPLFFDLSSRTQFVLLEYLNEEILSKKFVSEKDKYLEVLRKNLVIQTRRKNEPKHISDLYDPNNKTLKHLLDESYFPDEAFETPRCLTFLKTIGLQTCLSNDLCRILMNDIEYKVSQEEAGVGWTDELRKRSKYLYIHLIENFDKLDESILDFRFLEPYSPKEIFSRLIQPFEYKEFPKTCIKFSDAELHKYEHLVWSSSFILPSFVQTDNLNENVLAFLKLNRKPNFLTVNKNMTNLCDVLNNKEMDQLDDELESFLIQTLEVIYKYFSDLSRNDQDVFKELMNKEIVWSSSSKKFVSPEKLCLDIEEKDEIVPFLYSLHNQFKSYKTFFIQLGATEKAHPMIYGNILKKMAFVCDKDFLNSNELCKALKAEIEFFRLLKISINSEENESKNEKSENTPLKNKFTGLFFVSTELKLEKSGVLTVLDNTEQFNYVLKLPNEKYLFNPSEKLFKIKPNEIKPLMNAIHVAQRPILFSLKYEENYDFSLPEDFASQSQQMLICIECYYQEMFHNQQFHRSLARTISDKEARQSSPKYLSIDHIQKIIGERFSTIKFKCVEHLETALSFNKQKKLEQTVEEKACYLTYETSKFVTIYISKKHVKQPYFALCLARTLQPILDDLNYDHSICASLIASSMPQMNNLLQLANVSNEQNILTVIKQQYVPTVGNIYADDISLLSQYSKSIHDVMVGDLCVYFNPVGNYIYCKIISINLTKKSEETALITEFTVQIDETENIKISQKDLYVLENWKRVSEAVIAEPPSENLHLENMSLQIDPENDLSNEEILDENENRDLTDEKIEDVTKPLFDNSVHTEEQTIVTTSDILSTRLNRKENNQDNFNEALLWLDQAKSDLDSAENDMNPGTGKPSFEWVCYKCYRAVEKTLRGYHCFKGNGNKLPSTIFGNDLRRLLLGIETNIRDVAFKFCNIAGNESKTMQYPDFSRFEQPNQKEIFALSQKLKSEKALKYGKEVVDLVDQIIRTKSN